MRGNPRANQLIGNLSSLFLGAGVEFVCCFASPGGPCDEHHGLKLISRYIVPFDCARLLGLKRVAVGGGVVGSSCIPRFNFLNKHFRDRPEGPGRLQFLRSGFSHLY